MIKMPSTTGFMVQWETNKTFSNGKHVKDSICTKSEEKANRIKAEKEAAGFKNVNIYECIF